MRATATAPAFSPLYRQIKDLLLSRLQSGEWKPGEAIPSEMELASQFKVSQGTVRKAIDEMATENLLVRKQGKGTFVATHSERQVQYRFLRLRPDQGSLDDEGRAQRNVISFKKLRAPADIARALQLQSGEAIFHIRRTLSFQKVPTILEDIYLPAAAFKGITEQTIKEHQGATYALFEEEFGAHMVRAEEKLRAILATEEVAHILNIPLPSALLCVERIAYTYNNVALELRRGLYLTQTHHYHTEIN